MFKLRFYLLIAFLAFSSFVKSQHCPFDNARIIVVKAIDSISGDFIDDLEISLQDKDGNYLLNWDKKPLIFAINIDSTKSGWDYLNLMEIRYGFAENNYVRTFSCDLEENEKIYLVVEDKKSKKRHRYNTIKKEISADDFYELHDNIGMWTDLYKLKESPTPDEPFNKLITVKCSREK